MILSYFAANDTILIFEPPRNNSGVVGGKYLERSIVCKPKSADQFTDKYELTSTTSAQGGTSLSSCQTSGARMPQHDMIGLYYGSGLGHSHRSKPSQAQMG